MYLWLLNHYYYYYCCYCVYPYDNLSDSFQNIFLTSSGTIQLGDFGIAKVLNKLVCIFVFNIFYDLTFGLFTATHYLGFDSFFFFSSPFVVSSALSVTETWHVHFQRLVLWLFDYQRQILHVLTKQSLHWNDWQIVGSRKRDWEPLL